MTTSAAKKELTVRQMTMQEPRNEHVATPQRMQQQLGGKVTSPRARDFMQVQRPQFSEEQKKQQLKM